jgi:hypothetical protein
LKSQDSQFDPSASNVNRRFATAAAKSTSLLYMTIGSASGWRFNTANEQLAKNRKRLEAELQFESGFKLP